MRVIEPIVAAILITISGLPAAALMISPKYPVPTERLLDNLTRYATSHPDDSHARYLVGRVHAIAYVHDRKTFDTWGMPENPEKAERAPIFLDVGAQNHPEDPASAGPISEERRMHLESAIENYALAIELRPSSASAWLGLAYMCELAANLDKQVAWKASVRVDGLPQAPRSMLKKKQWLEIALLGCRRAYDVGMSSQMYEAFSVEGGEGILRLYKALHMAGMQGKYAVRNVKENLARMRKLPQAVSPIIFSLSSAKALTELTTNLSVVFDLDGFGRGASWPWIKPDTALLVWDPERSGEIRSGRQLFGSVTWWVFWRDGYQALAALDNNVDGWLRGTELDGIAVWTDRNSNGISDPGEVVPIENLGVRAIATVIDGHLSSGEPYISSGIEMTDGTMRSTYDWTPTSAK